MTKFAAIPDRSIFIGLGAWVGRLDERTTCAWWADDPNHLKFDQSLLIRTDLSLNPTAYVSGRISLEEIQVDDAPIDGGLTKLGPTWPTGSTINGIWLEQAFYNSLPQRPAFPQPFMSCHDYELTTAIYWTPKARRIERRYWGVHAEITAEQGALALCTIWTPGSSKTQRPAGTWWVDLATQADPLANGLTAIGTGAAPKQGALFIDGSAFRGLKLAGPKIPPWEGGLAIPLSKPTR